VADLAYRRVPKGRRENLEFRAKLARKCLADRKLAADVRELCRHDLLFWLNAFSYVHEPRHPEDTIKPFLTYPYQDDFLRELEVALGKEDVAVVKSRCMGASWTIMALFVHRWQFWPGLMFGVVSREERLVDGMQKSLFAKAQFVLDRQPGFLLPQYDHFHLQFVNRDNGSSIEGSTTTGNVFRGDRYTAVLMDEFAAFDPADSEKAWASSHGATPCRILNSTPQGRVGMFHKVATQGHAKRIDLPWWKHPDYAQGVYFSADGKRRSPWYDGECRRLIIPGKIAAELDMDFAGSASPFFPEALLQEHGRKHARPPVAKKVFTTRSNKTATLELWDYLDPPPKANRYVVGSDLSMGTGATPSVLSAADRATREKVGRVRTPHLSPDEFAEVAKQVCDFLNHAYLIWEMNGPGVTFGKRVMELGQSFVYFRQDEIGLKHKVQSSLTPGWYASAQNKLMLLQDYARALETDGFVNHSAEGLEDCRGYVYLPNGQVGSHLAETASDPSGARQNHGDEVIADALCNKALGAEPQLTEQGEPKLSTDPGVLLPGHPLHYTQHARMLAAEQAGRKDDYWAERGNASWDRGRFRRLEW
jgi:hypothetical protein